MTRTDTQPTCIADVMPYYMNDSEHQQQDRVHAALEAAGFTLEWVPVEGVMADHGHTYPKWCRDGVVFNSSRDAMALQLDATTLRKARKASRARSI